MARFSGALFGDGWQAWLFFSCFPIEGYSSCEDSVDEAVDYEPCQGVG